jgi:uncharacterized pyridoxal phosphate-containing UPF0001 family protein
MGMATNTKDVQIVKKEFKGLRVLFDSLKKGGVPVEILSMGMSQDWHLALEEGSTLVRIGSAIFDVD